MDTTYQLWILYLLPKERISLGRTSKTWFQRINSLREYWQSQYQENFGSLPVLPISWMQAYSAKMNSAYHFNGYFFDGDDNFLDQVGQETFREVSFWKNGFTFRTNFGYLGYLEYLESTGLQKLSFGRFLKLKGSCAIFESGKAVYFFGSDWEFLSQPQIFNFNYPVISVGSTNSKSHYWYACDNVGQVFEMTSEKALRKMDLPPIIRCEVGNYRICAEDQQHHIWIWEPTGNPILLVSDLSAPLRQISIGDEHLLCLDVFRGVWGFGKNKNGQLGELPEVVENLTLWFKEGVVAIGCGPNQSFIQLDSGFILGMGSNNYGQIDGITPDTSEDLSEPLEISETSEEFEDNANFASLIGVGSTQSIFLVEPPIYLDHTNFEQLVLKSQITNYYVVDRTYLHLWDIFGNRYFVHIEQHSNDQKIYPPKGSLNIFNLYC